MIIKTYETKHPTHPQFNKWNVSLNNEMIKDTRGYNRVFDSEKAAIRFAKKQEKNIKE